MAIGSNCITQYNTELRIDLSCVHEKELADQIDNIKKKIEELLVDYKNACERRIKEIENKIKNA